MKCKFKIVLLSINVFFLISMFLGIPTYAIQNNLSVNSSDVSSRLLPISDDISMFIPSEKGIQYSSYQIQPIPPVKPDPYAYRSLSTTTFNNNLKITSLNYTDRAKLGELVNISFNVDGYIDNTNYYIGIYDWASGTWIKEDYKFYNGTFSKKYDWNITMMPTEQRYWSYWLSTWYWESSNSSWIYLDGSDINIYELPDLTVKDILFSNNIAMINISNSGYTSASNISYKVFDGNPNPNYLNNNSYRKTKLIQGDIIPILNSSEVNLISVLFPIDQDFHNAYVSMDPMDTIKETNESNNNGSKAMRLNSTVHELDVLAVIYTNYVYNNLSMSQIDFTKSKINNFKQFYWDHTLTLRLNLSYIQIDDLYTNSHLWQISPGKFWMSPWDVESDLRNRGVNDNGFDTIFVFYAWQNTIGSGAAYGGAAYGPGINWMGNISYASEPIFCWDPNIIDEIAIHENLHNIDGMYQDKGDFSFKNSDNMNLETTFNIPMDYYQWMLETWPTQRWFELKWGYTDFIPHSITNLSLKAAGTTWLNFTWFNPPDPDFSHVMLYLNGTFKIIIPAPQNYYNFTGLKPDTVYELGTLTVDNSENINQRWVNRSATTAPLPDTTTPDSVTNLRNITYVSNYINWTWADPADTDFSKVIIYLNGTFQRNVTNGTQYYNATGLTPNTMYEIGTRTVDLAGNINETWKNNTAFTAPLPATRFINGTIKDNSTGNELAGVTVSANSTLSTTSDPTGFYSFAVTDGTYNLISTINDIRFYTNTTTVSTIGQAVLILDIEMIRKPTGNIIGSVTS